jgi:hypothetical protein
MDAPIGRIVRAGALLEKFGSLRATVPHQEGEDEFCA